MSFYYLENQRLKVTVNSVGAELHSIWDKLTGQEYLWNGDPKYWMRRAPILFPVVGTLKDKQFTYGGRIYPMEQHGFARDMEMLCTEETKERLWFMLKDNEASRAMYPFAFVLELGYELQGNDLKVLWRVTNPAKEMLYFSIGAHPGFMCPLNAGENQWDYYLDFHTDKDIRYHLIKEAGLLGIYDEHLPLDHGVTPIDAHMFDRDALVIENHQSQCVSLLDSKKRPYVTMTFDAPLFGVWSPTGKNAPFVCIEPWYGRCDAVDFNGSLEQRAYGQSLESGGVFEREYVITIHER